jgi:lipopolysaccharide/colanic/teichoic acid biosynthesis glycosyltransferase
VTGLSQISGRSKLPMRQGLDLDLQYVHSRTFWLDLRILIKTLPAVFTADGAP